MYVIHKRSRSAREDSYSGPTWDRAGIRDEYRKQYAIYDYALFLANKLSEYNPVGFIVSKA